MQTQPSLGITPYPNLLGLQRQCWNRRRNFRRLRIPESYFPDVCNIIILNGITLIWFILEKLISHCMVSFKCTSLILGICYFVSSPHRTFIQDFKVPGFGIGVLSSSKAKSHRHFGEKLFMFYLEGHGLKNENAFSQECDSFVLVR